MSSIRFNKTGLALIGLAVIIAAAGMWFFLWSGFFDIPRYTKTDHPWSCCSITNEQLAAAHG